MHPFLISLIVLAQTPPVVTIDRDNFEITQSCTIQIAAERIIDADNNGVIHITSDGITVDFADQKLHGASPQVRPNEFTGTGIQITAKNVTLHNAKVSGYKVGIHAIEANGLTIHDCNVSNNFHQRLKSTPKAEDGSDWLWPHANDNNEWITNYGAGLCVEDSNNVTIHNIRARKGQNGIILDRVNDSKVYDCDCLFLSGWGLAMWRSNRNVISRNAFDFCVRGYSHGVYNRGQDSAGILMFEQCCENIIAENSATHCGDGFFGFAGKEALGEVNPRKDIEWYKRRGCNKNIFNRNDFSYAAAHGLELTFSFDNVIQNNTFNGNAICGVWGGYSQRTHIHGNTLHGNGDMASGLERGGINIEHGRENVMSGNDFDESKCGIHLWWDEDVGTQQLPWAKVNGTDSTANQILMNEFDGDGIGVQLRETDDTLFSGNRNGARIPIEADNRSQKGIGSLPDEIGSGAPVFGVVGNNKPINARSHFIGRDHIIMTEWGPYDWASFLLHRVDGGLPSEHEYRLLGSFPRIFRGLKADNIDVEGNVDIEVKGETGILVRPRDTSAITPYSIGLLMSDHEDGKLHASGVLIGGTWSVRTFASACDPRQDADRWRREGEASHQTVTTGSLNFAYGHTGMSELHEGSVPLPHDHFGTIAMRSLTFPAGTWRIKTLSDDGICVWLDDQLIIDDWTHHAPKEHTHEFTVDKPREINMRVEHFELDGYAVLSLEIESVN